MEKKTYLAPRTERIQIEANTNLLNWSAGKVPGGGGNTPEAKELELTEDGFPKQGFNLWED